MDDMLRILHYIAAGIIIIQTIFVFGGEADVHVELVGEGGKCVNHDGSPPADETNCGSATGENDAQKKTSCLTKTHGGKQCVWQEGSGADAGIWKRFYSILFAGDNLTKWGKIFISLVAIGLMVWNVNVSNSNWLFSVVLFGYIVISYGGLQRTYSNKVGKYGTTDEPDDSRQRGCNFVIPKNSYYSAKFLELRIGYIFLIMITAILICYRNIKGGCWGKDTFNTVISIFSPLLMIFGLLIISYVVTPATSESSGTTLVGGGTAMDYVLSFFRGTPITAASGGSGNYQDDWSKTIGFPTLPDRTGRTEAESSQIMKPDDAGTADINYIKAEDRLTRVKQRVYMKFIIVVSIFGFLIYSSARSEIKCGLDLNSIKTLLTKAPTYIIAIIVFSPFIIKNIIINETVIDYTNSSYNKYEGGGQEGDKAINVGELKITESEYTAITDFSLECMIDKMGGLEIYTLLCLLCILMYAGEGTGYKLNMVAACVVASIAIGYAMDQSS